MKYGDRIVVKRSIFSVNTLVPNDDVTEISYNSTRTLLDADIVLFSPSLDVHFDDPYYKGKQCLSENRSFAELEKIRHWRNEITTAAEIGKMIVVFLEEPISAFRQTDKTETSKTGRNRDITLFVEQICSYDSLPFIQSHSSKAGSKVKLTENGSIIVPYWNEFSPISSYHVELCGDFSEALLKSQSGNRIVGAIKQFESGGAILYLPPINFVIRENMMEEEEEEEEEGWTEDELRLGKKFVTTICALAEAIASNRAITPPPDWSLNDHYQIQKEITIRNKIAKINEQLSHLEQEKIALQEDLWATGGLRRLLFEKGKPLEEAILDSLRTMGFDAMNHSDGESEFDIVFSSPTGKRFLGEAEGRDNKAIDITKFSQMERNLHEDYERDDVDKMAEGALFGNGYRLRAPDERGETFTQKCQTAAKRTGSVLVRTADMFEPTRYLKEHPEDQEYAEACRHTIEDAEGDIVKFPTPPVTIDPK